MSRKNRFGSSSGKKLALFLILALPVFNIDKFAVVIPIESANSLDRIFRLASITSTFIIIAIVKLLVRYPL